MRAVSVHLEVALGSEYRYRVGPPFLYEAVVTVSVHLVDAKGLLDDVGISGSPAELDRLADALRAAAAHGRAEPPPGQARPGRRHVHAVVAAGRLGGRGSRPPVRRRRHSMVRLRRRVPAARPGRYRRR